MYKFTRHRGAVSTFLLYASSLTAPQDASKKLVLPFTSNTLELSAKLVKALLKSPCYLATRVY